ncbi:MAG: choice-of-anchor B family protein [Saprospiraceae bacterium]
MKLQKQFSSLLLGLAISTLGFAQNQNITFRSKLSFPGQTVANMSGWASPDGKEYALVGASKGLIIVDVTDPDVPVQIVQLPGPDNFWKEIKTYSHYAYVVSEGGQGVQIVDLSALPSANVPNKFYLGDGAIANQINTIHALHIDLTKGFLYAYGSNLFNGGAVVLDLNTDPWNPTYVGKFDQLGYIHDGYVDNDTLYAGHINFGIFSVVDMSDKTAPLVLNTQSTPNHFTHNTWLSEDRKTLFTTDETANSYLAAYDVSNPDDIKFLDKMQTGPGSGSIVHNTHVLGNYAITAWYTEGLNIVDVTKPNSLVETGKYDTYPQGSGGGFDGCWGVYPYLPSGNFVAGNINPAELWVLTPSYQRACYLEGKITDASNGQAISGAQVQILGNTTSTKTTGPDGLYNTGQAQEGMAQLLVSKFGYYSTTVPVDLLKGEVTTVNISLTPVPSYTISGSVVTSNNGSPIPNAQVAILSADTSFYTIADANGQFALSNIVEGKYDIVAGIWGYRYRVVNQDINASNQLIMALDKGYQDDFVFDYGWSKSGSSLTGIWERTDAPLGVDVGILVAPNADFIADIGYSCYVTGNGSSEIDADDVEDGTSILTSPMMDLSNYPDPRITAQVWFVSATFNQEFLDSIKIYLSNGIEEKLIWQRKGDNFAWQFMQVDATDFLPVTNTMQLRVVCFDNPTGMILDTYEAALDRFRVTGVTVGTEDLFATSSLIAMPNPFNHNTLLSYQNVGKNSLLKVFDLAGRPVQNFQLEASSGQISIGEGLPNGVYFARIEQDGQVSKPLKVVKVN